MIIEGCQSAGGSRRPIFDQIDLCADWAIVIAMIGSVTVAGIAISLFVTLTIIRLLAWLFGG
ncbi:MAG: hypothetical protein ACOVMP_09680 [Chthoniobacterales bacterium]